MTPAIRRRAPRRAAASLILAFAAATIASSPALAAPATARLCAKRATLRDTPGGFAVGYVYRPARLTILATDEDGDWVRVRLKTKRRGWMVASALCDGKDDD